MKISKSNTYAINWLVSQNKSVQDIASELKLSEDQIIKYLEKHQVADSQKLPIKSGPIKSKELMIRHTRDKKTNNVAIMTKEASEVNDELKRKSINNNIGKNQECIFKPNN